MRFGMVGSLHCEAEDAASILNAFFGAESDQGWAEKVRLDALFLCRGIQATAASSRMSLIPPALIMGAQRLITVTPEKGKC